MSGDREYARAYNSFRTYLDATYAAGGGQAVLGLSTGYPAPKLFPLPDGALRRLAAHEDGVEKSRAGYGWETGSSTLRSKLLAYEKLAHGLDYQSNQIAMVAGGTYGLNRVVERLIESDSLRRREVLVPIPSFFRQLGRVAQYGNVRCVLPTAADGLHPSAQTILGAVTEETRAIILLNPTNPFFTYLPEDLLEKLPSALTDQGVYIVIDESGDAFAMRDARWRPTRMPACVGRENVIRIVTASKKYLMAEYRIGYVLASAEFMGDKMDGFVRLVGDDMGNPPLAANEALEHVVEEELELLSRGGECSSAFQEQMSRNLARNAELRDLALMRLSDLSAVHRTYASEANFNLVFQLREGVAADDVQWFLALLRAKRVSVVPGSGFGLPARSLFFRLTYALPRDDLMRGLDAMEDFLSKGGPAN